MAEERNRERSRSKRGKIYEPGDVSQVLLSLFLGRWLAGEELLLLGPRAGGEGEAVGFFL